MSEHATLCVDSIVTSITDNNGSPLPIAVEGHSLVAKNAPFSFDKQRPYHKSSSSALCKDNGELHRTGSESFDHMVSNQDPSKPLHTKIATGECRICQDEDDVLNLEVPCACTGSLKFAHRKCVQHWCDEKGDTICEICCKPYEGGYTNPPSSARADSFSISIGSWEVGGEQQFTLPGSRHFSMTAEHVFVEPDYEDVTRANARSAACFRSVAFILMVLLLLRQLLSMTSTSVGEDASNFIVIFFLKAVAFVLPCYITTRAVNALICRRQREEAALAAAEVAYLLQNGQPYGVPETIAMVQ